MRLPPEAKCLTGSPELTPTRRRAPTSHSAPEYAWTGEEGLAWVRELVTTPAQLLPEEAAGVLRLRFHSLADPRSNRVLAALGESLIAAKACFPGTDLQLLSEPPVLETRLREGRRSEIRERQCLRSH